MRQARSSEAGSTVSGEHLGPRDRVTARYSANHNDPLEVREIVTEIAELGPDAVVADDDDLGTGVAEDELPLLGELRFVHRYP